MHATACSSRPPGPENTMLDRCALRKKEHRSTLACIAGKKKDGAAPALNSLSMRLHQSDA